MPLTRDEFVDKMMLIHEEKKKLKKLSADRESEESAVSSKYQVEQCNRERNAIAIKFANEQQKILNNIKKLESEI